MKDSGTTERIDLDVEIDLTASFPIALLDIPTEVITPVLVAQYAVAAELSPLTVLVLFIVTLVGGLLMN